MQAKQKRPYTTWLAADAGSFLDIYGDDSEDYDNTKKQLAGGMDVQFFQEKNAKLNKALRDTLGLASKPYLLKTGGKRPGTKRGLNMTPEQIHIIKAGMV
ncbi:hypothetical protein SAMN05216339_105142 [Nitrosomonas eutropha]|uniref:Uncharacterized protein n=1 Tax=Nitrosomonas eutropha TaxID=916 RepID=A0A1I7HPP7_9PROT|nr:hypothetical protein [Nitrosomonas eutropha]SFU62613.1 hypothetical protein SAMN05216339_105142 [Nitrosomonas eutropha]